MVDDVTSVANTGHAIAALSVDTFCPLDDFKRQVDVVVRQMRESERLPGVERIFVPGEQSAEKMHDRMARGIPMPGHLRVSLDACARDLGLAPLE